MCGYNHPSHYRKVEFLADSPEFEILQIVVPNDIQASGTYPSANGQHTYRVQTVPAVYLGGPRNPHRIVHWPPRFGLGTFKPDVIHCEHEQESLLAAQAALLRDGYARGKPLILHSWQNILRKRSLPARMVCYYTLRAAQHVLCGNSEAADVLYQQGYHGNVVYTNIIGLDRRYFYPKDVSALRQELGLDGVVVGYFGRRSSEKGVDIFLRGMAQAQTPAQIVVGGFGPETENLIKLAQELGLMDRCHFLDGTSIPYEHIVDYMNLLDILVVPSQTTPHWKEQLGRVVIEGMACKIAVVGSDSGAIPEVLGDGGCVFPEDDPVALAGIIDDLAANPDKRRNLAERGYQRVLEVYSVERIAERVAHLWRNL